ncbi:hypothetical protein BCR44DRAFT_1428282 [Catenaria anguillulae PL171]|uniref:EF-hand domain-containing protein n=1 Tax=Catenaria anguillulae PL171 TaxID=765915 RepID=A0A1Y2HV05_9FUNG|nr:hypothetical protein BCR44DRAFT_1428282 [Catenaria anguillulae PL171]
MDPQHHSPSTPQGAQSPRQRSPVDIVEDRIRSHVFHARIRISEYFKDYDRLHSGYISFSQFRRCLAVCIEKGPRLSDNEFNLLCDKYDTRRDGTVNYLRFIDSIDKVFGGRNLEKTPTLSVDAPGQWLRDPRPLSPSVEAKCLELIERIRVYVRHHGFDVKSWYRDFDSHNSGIVTVNQYRRGFPPNLLTPEEMDVLMLMFHDHGAETVNYKKLNTLVNRRSPIQPDQSGNRLVPTNAAAPHHHAPVGTEIILESSQAVLTHEAVSLDRTLEEIKRYAYIQRIRMVDFFRDYDHHNQGIVSEHQFCAALKLVKVNLSKAQLDMLLSTYRSQDGRINYRSFCDTIEEIFTTRAVEKNPVLEVALPDRNSLIKQVNKLSPEDEAVYESVITRIRRKVDERRINTLSFFKDLDKKAGGCYQVTKSQFARLLSLAGLEVTQKELFVLLDKFQDPHHINYINFVHEASPLDEHERLPKMHKVEEEESYSVPDRDVNALLITIQNQVYMKSLRVCEFLRDYDRSRTGCYELLANHFKHPEKRDCCRWRDFEQWIERSHGYLSDLEKRPSYRIQPPSVAIPAIHPRTEQLTLHENASLYEILTSLRAHISRRATSMKTQFHSFDKLRTGRVTRAQLRQVLSWVEADVSDSAFELICRNWTDVELGDFCYLPFLATVESESHDAKPDPMPPQPPTLSTEHLADDPQELEKRHTGMPIDVGFASSIPAAGNGLNTGSGGGVIVEAGQAKPKPLVPLSDDELSTLLLRLKSKIKTERIRVYDALRDFDPRRCGRITRGCFERGLNRFNFQLNRREVFTLTNRYAVPSTDGNGPPMVDYRAFSDDMEVFTVKGLEQAPTAEVPEFRPIWHELRLRASGKEAALSLIMHAIAESLRQRRMYFLLRYLEDHDKIHNGTIPREKFHSAMIAAGCRLTEAEVDLIVAGYALEDHDDNIDYLAFNRDLMEMSKEVWKGETNLVEAIEGRRHAVSTPQPGGGLAM